MKKSIILGMVTLAGLSFTSCNQFLDDNRWPLDSQTDNSNYWNNAVNVNAQLNGLYGYYNGYGNGTSWVNNFYYRSLSDDQCGEMLSGTGVTFSQWKYQYAPESNDLWDDGYTAIRKCNTVVIKVGDSSLGSVEKANAIGIARLNRAYQYYQLVRCFGDVPLVETILDPEDEALYGPRTERNTVMDFVLDDLNYAVENIQQKSNKIEFSADMANAMKAEICLFEAAYAKYHESDNTRAQKYFNEVVNACNAVMSSYQLCSDYQALYNSVWSADESRGMVSLKDNPEVIFMKGYQSGVLGHSMLKYLSSNTVVYGMTKDAFDAYLFKDGKPKALTSENTSDCGVADENGNINIENLFTVRDARLGKTIDPYLAYNGNMWTRKNAASEAISDPLSSNTGYTIRKFINTGMTYNECTIDGSGYTNAPIYWLAQIYLDYAEARAELGQLTDSDLDLTINKLYARAGLPAQTVASLTAMQDPANNMGVSSLLWEIRRCRRCELMFDCYTRYWDLVRWHKLDLLDTTNYPNIAMGANVSAAPAGKNDGIMTTGDYINAALTSAGTSVRTFTEREYFFPIGTTNLKLNPNLTQNPGW